MVGVLTGRPWFSSDEQVQCERAAYTFAALLTFSLGIWFQNYSYFLTYDVTDGSTTEAATLSYYSWAVYSAIQIVAYPVLGTISDSVGRKPLLILAASVYLLDIPQGFIPTVPVFLFTSALMGLDASNAIIYALVVDSSTGTGSISKRKNSGNTAAASSTKKTWIADVASSVSVLYFYVAVGFVAGILVGLAVANAHSYAGGVVASGFAVIPIILFCIDQVPETLRREQRRPFSCRALGAAVCDQFKSVKLLTSTWNLKVMSVLYFLWSAVNSGAMLIIIFWLQYKFNWQTEDLALSMCMFTVVAGLGLIFAERVLFPRYGHRNTMICCFFWVAIMTGFLGLCTSTNAVFIVILFMPAGIGLSPAINALYAVEVPPHEQGRLQGSMSCLMVIAYILAGYVYTALYDDTVNYDYDQGSTEAMNDLSTSILWWLSAGGLALCGVLGFFLKEEPDAEAEAEYGSEREKQTLLS